MKLEGIGLVWSNLIGEGDILLAADGSIDRGDPLLTSSFVSLFTRRRAVDLDVAELRSVPSGWWADTIGDEPLGSLLWTLRQAKITQETIRQAQLFSAQALNWWLSDGVAKSVTITTARNGTNRIDIRIDAVQSDNDRWAHVWEGIDLSGL